MNELILENKGTFENKRVNNIYEYGVYGKTIRHKLYAGDKKERYFHLYHSISKESAERIEIENRINQMTQYLKKYQNKVKEFGPGFEKYFNLHYDEKSQAFILPEERCSVVERELDLAGYFCIVTSEKMSAKEAIELVRQLDNIYRLDHAVTANQKVILKAFGLDANSIKYFASELSKELKKAE